MKTTTQYLLAATAVVAMAGTCGREQAEPVKPIAATSHVQIHPLQGTRAIIAMAASTAITEDENTVTATWDEELKLEVLERATVSATRE